MKDVSGGVYSVPFGSISRLRVHTELRLTMLYSVPHRNNEVSIAERGDGCDDRDSKLAAALRVDTCVDSDSSESEPTTTDLDTSDEDMRPPGLRENPHRLVATLKSNNRLRLCLRGSQRRKNRIAESRLVTQMILAGAYGGQAHVWMYHEYPHRHYYVYNPSRTAAKRVDAPDEYVSASEFPGAGNLALPSALWFMDERDAAAAKIATPLPPVEELWNRFDEHMWRLCEEWPPGRCAECRLETCWRVVPHVELPDYTNRPILEAWARFAERDAPRALKLFARMGASAVFESCCCDRCCSRIDPRPPHGPIVYHADGANLERFVAPPATPTSDYDFVAETPYRGSLQIDCLVQDACSWNTSGIGSVLTWLLEHDFVDSHRWAREIDECFRSLYRVGNTSLALPLGMYASREAVVAEINDFMRAHADNEGDCPCLLNVIGSTRTVTALHMLSIARGVPLPKCHNAYHRLRQRYLDSTVYARALLLMLGTNDDDERSVPNGLAVLAMSKVFTAHGFNGLREIENELALPTELTVELTRRARLIVRQLCNRLFVDECLGEARSLLSTRTGLLGHCNPCDAKRRRDGRHVPRFRFNAYDRRTRNRVEYSRGVQ